ncbi:hypothetical protein CR513_30228, partial [Mucuna pruriens]
MGPKIDTPICKLFKPRGNDALNNKLFPSTLTTVAMQWLSCLLAQTIQMFSNLATLFISQFMANKEKHLKVAYLFDNKQAKGENLKGYNSAVRVSDSNQKFYVKTFQKGLRAGQFNNSLAPRKPPSMEEIRTRAKKHIEGKEDLIDRLEVECQPLALQAKTSHGPSTRANREGDIYPMLGPMTSQSSLHPPRSHEPARTYNKPTEVEKQIGKKPRERSKSRQCPNTSYCGTIATISGCCVMDGRIASARKRYTRALLAVQGDPPQIGDLVICFSDEDYRVDYKIERVLINHGSSVNSTFQKLGLPISSLRECLGTLFGFAGEQIEIRGTIKIETVFEEEANACSIPVTYTIINAWASYNVIIGCPALNKLRAVVSTPHLYMKYLVGRDENQKIARRCYKDSLRVGPRSVNSNTTFVNFLDLDPCHQMEDLRPCSYILAPSKIHRTKIGITLDTESEGCLVHFLIKNQDVFALSSTDMLGID